ncbi:tripartite tricarboxylate transporter TctB family protein [Szabonella alba]|uniref:Tripartite tricarboxylate transporter TctB family protein n=1 Tax=Szabonella alba TaxID=2804194 RepID=A0A8K0Y2U1_9RHOB|nr:tripartite tricarboxylate transporter TctB family protein [Szabonella alba]MBL4919264.1 tripartite tricarboxylate transporter TctB family protein [Szabonella alba]
MTDRLLGAFLLLVGIAYAVATSFIQVGFTSDTLGPRAVPYLLGFVLILLSAALILRPARPVVIEWPRGAVLLSLGLAVGSFILYALAIEPLGFVISTILQVGFLSLLFGARPLPALIGAVLTTAALYGLFNFLLGLRLPGGLVFGG